MFFHVIEIWTDLSTVLSQFTRVTDERTDRQIDRQTDRILIARQRLHSMQRGKNLQGNSRCLPRRLARMVTITSLYSHQFR